jgi:proline dehydrogenase
MKNSIVSFDDTETAFRSKSNADLMRAFWLFRIISYNWLVQISPPFVKFALWARLPVKGIIRATAFRHFCGGESIEDCTKTIKELAKFRIGTILDYSVEGKESEEDFERALQQTLATIQRAKGDPDIPFSVFKPSGFARISLLEKVNEKKLLSESEQEEYSAFYKRICTICRAGFENNVPIYIDAEESWIQDVVDEIAKEMMMKYNQEKAIIYNTLQMYRHDRLEFLSRSIQHAMDNNYYAGFKLVRGAYMEKERERALKMNYPSPIQENKQRTDEDYNAALKICMDHIDRVYLCAGTHNEESCLLLTELMAEKKLSNDHDHIWFSQLYGMSDHITFNLAKKNYNTSKYVPYGPVASVLPYLIRRAQENTSVAGQTGRELRLIGLELKRRKALGINQISH